MRIPKLNPEALSENPLYRLQVRLRWLRTLIVALPPTVAGGLLAVGIIARLAGGDSGVVALAGVGFLAVTLPFFVAAATAGCMVAERRRGSIEPLILSPLTDWEILRGMFLACASPALFSLLLMTIVAAFLIGPHLSGLTLLLGLAFSGVSACYFAGAVGLLFGARIRSLKYAAAPVALACAVTALTIPLGAAAVIASLAEAQWNLGALLSCLQTFLCLAATPLVVLGALRGLRPQ